MLHTLYQNHIPVLKKESVEAYKAKVVYDLKHPRPELEKIRVVDSKYLLAGFVIMVIGFVVWVSNPTWRSFGAATMALGAVLSIRGALGNTLSVYVPGTPRNQAEWQIYPLSRSPVQVPPDVLRNYDKLQNVLPEVRGFVHVIYRDPIFEVCLVDPVKNEILESEYIAVWDEPGFTE